MKKSIILLFLLLISSNSIGQNLPELKLQANKSIEIPEKLKKNEIAFILEQFGGWSAYNNLTFYIFKNNGKIVAYNKQTPKSYLKKNKELRETITNIKLTTIQEGQLNENLVSELTSEFLKYSQKDFRNNHINSNSKCMISDATGYTLTFVQNGKERSYTYYAPEYYLTKCKDENINKVVLEKFIKLVKMWILNK